MKKIILVLVAFLAVQNSAYVNGNTPPSFESIQLTVDPDPAREASVITVSPVGWEDADGDTEQYLYTWYNQNGRLRGAVDFTNEQEGQYQGITSVEISSPFPLPSGQELKVPVAGVQKGTVKFTSPSGVETVHSIPDIPEAEGSNININGSLTVNLDEVGEYTVTETLQAIIRSTYALVPFETQAGERQFSWTYLNPVPGERLYRYMTPVHQITLTATGDLEASIDIANPGAEVIVTITLTRGVLRDSSLNADIDYLLAFSKSSSLTLSDRSITERSLSGANFDAGDEVYVIITPYDGKDRGNSVESDRIQILNTPPRLSGVEVTTDVEPSAIPNILTALAHGWSDDDEDAEQIAYQWHNQDGAIPDATEATLAQEFNEGDTFFVEATPFDGIEDGETVRSASIIIPSGAKSTDINGDGVVNILDLVFVANNLGMQVVEGTNSSADVNKDGVINILDLVAVAADF
jgi:hypothetical protein